MQTNEVGQNFLELISTIACLNKNAKLKGPSCKMLFLFPRRKLNKLSRDKRTHRPFPDYFAKLTCTYSSKLIMQSRATSSASSSTIKSFFLQDFWELEKETKLCQNITCKAGRECRLLSTGVAADCVCISHCPDKGRPICGSDGLLYKSHCELHRQACLRGE